MSFADSSEIPPICPRCSGHGLARGLEINHDRRTLRYECDVCTHKWDITDVEPLPTWNGVPIQPA